MKIVKLWWILEYWRLKLIDRYCSPTKRQVNQNIALCLYNVKEIPFWCFLHLYIPQLLIQWPFYQKNEIIQSFSYQQVPSMNFIRWTRTTDQIQRPPVPRKNIYQVFQTLFDNISLFVHSNTNDPFLYFINEKAFIITQISRMFKSTNFIKSSFVS